MRTRAGRRAPLPLAAAHTFGTAEVARILGITPGRVRSLVRAGLCRPALRGHALQFAFQDLVLLRAARGLMQAAIPARRVRRALTELARQLPPDRPLSGVRVYADGRQVVARDGRAAWRPADGQIVFSFAVDELARRAGVVVPVGSPRAASARGGANANREAAMWFDRALLLEDGHQLAAARTAYERALQINPQLRDAYINLGRLVHEAGDAVAAARLYHLALECGADAIAHYNLALALEDQAQENAAVAHYRRALGLDPCFADAHFNLGRLLERLGRRRDALRHLLTYKKLTHNA